MKPPKADLIQGLEPQGSLRSKSCIKAKVLSTASFHRSTTVNLWLDSIDMTDTKEFDFLQKCCTQNFHHGLPKNRPQGGLRSKIA